LNSYHSLKKVLLEVPVDDYMLLWTAHVCRSYYSYLHFSRILCDIAASPRCRFCCLVLASASSFLPHASPRPRRNWLVYITAKMNFVHCGISWSLTRSQAAARILADRILPHSTFGGHVTSSVTWPFDSPQVISYWWSFGTKPLSLTVSEIGLFNVECNAMVDVTLIRPLNKGQGHSFWYQSISHIGCQ